MKKVPLFPLIATLAAASLLGLGCNPIESAKEKAVDAVSEKVAEKVAEGVLGKATGGEVDLDSGNNQVAYKDNKTGNSMIYGENVKIPEDFPKDVPVYPGARATSVVITKTGDEGASLTLETDDAVSKVLAWYTEQLKSWTEDSSVTASDMEIREYSTTGAKLVLTITPEGEDKGSIISIARTTVR